MTEIDVSFEYGKVYAVDLATLANNQQITGGPCDLMGWSVRDAAFETNQQASGSVVAPAAGAAIASIASVQTADYNINWQVQLTGAAAAADLNNFGLFAGVTQLIASENAGAAGVYPQPSLAFYDKLGAAIAIKAIGAGTAGVTYTAQLTIVPQAVAGPILQLQDGNQEFAEIGAPVFATDTKWFGPGGIRVNGTLKVVQNVGFLAGAIYVRFHKD